MTALRTDVLQEKKKWLLLNKALVLYDIAHYLYTPQLTMITAVLQMLKMLVM